MMNGEMVVDQSNSETIIQSQENNHSNKCHICNKCFEKTKNLKKHIKLHGPKQYKCDICENSYSRSDHLNRHLVSHQDNPKPHQCEICVQRFDSRSHLQRHVRMTHNNEKRYKCPKCEENFDKKFKLNKHTRKCMQSPYEVSTKDKFHFCYYPFCQTKFYNEEKLKLHVERQHNCKVEQKVFYRCPYDECFRAYSTNFNLKVHMKTFHIGIKDYKCEECGHLFKHNCTLAKHRAKFHSNLQENYSTREANESNILESFAN